MATKFNITLRTVLNRALVLCALLAWASPVQAQVCMAHKDLVKTLTKNHGESLRSIGFVGKQGAIGFWELYASPAGSWTTVFTDTRGVSCVLLVGAGLETVPPPESEDEPS